MQERTYAVGPSTITLRFGDLRSSRAEVLVSSDDYLLSMSGGVSAALRAAAGPQLAMDAHKLLPARPGDVVVSSAGTLPAKYVFHAVTIGARPGEVEPDAIVRQASRRAMQLLRMLRCRSIAFPAIGAGTAGIAPEVVAAEMATSLVESLLNSDEALRVELYLRDHRGSLDQTDFFVFFEQFAARRLVVTAPVGSATPRFERPVGAQPGMNAAQAEEARRLEGIHAMLSRLDARRDEVERTLVDALDGPASALAALREQLAQIAALRAHYEAEAAGAAPVAAQVVPRSVFVSSTSRDLEPHRLAVRAAVEAMQLRFVGMEGFGADGAAPVNVIRAKVLASASYVGMLGMRYGHVDPGTNQSMTEIEYQQAVAASKPLHLFVMDDSAPLTAGMVEKDPRNFAQLLRFKAYVMDRHTCKLFTTPQDLAQKVRETLAPDGP